MVKYTRIEHKETKAVMTFLRIEPIKYGMAIEHYIFNNNGRELAMPIGEWIRVKNDWKIIS